MGRLSSEGRIGSSSEIMPWPEGDIADYPPPWGGSDCEPMMNLFCIVIIVTWHFGNQGINNFQKSKVILVTDRGQDDLGITNNTCT